MQNDQIATSRRLANVGVLISQIILIFAYLNTTEKTSGSSKSILKFITLHNLKNKDSHIREYGILNTLKFHEKLSFHSNDVIFNYRFLFMMITSIFSYLVIILQFEMESLSVNQFGWLVENQ